MSDEWISNVQSSLGNVIKAPKMTEKLLRKPPFRFLHDIVTNFLKATGFPEGLYTPDELDSAKVTDKESKVSFLSKIIDCVNSATGTPTSARAAVIVTGAEPENTGDFLCKLASCAQLSKEEIKRAVSGQGTAPGGEGETATSEPPPKKVEQPPPEPPAKQEPPPKQKDKGGEVPAVSPITPTDSRPQRPQSASSRKAPPAHKNNEVTEDTTVKGPAAPVIKEGGRAEENDGEAKDKDWMKLVEEEEARAKRTTNQNEGDAKGYLAKEALEAKREQEEAQRKAREEAAKTTGESSEGIVLKTKRGKDRAGGSMGDNELVKLREQLQLLTKASNPLGKFLEAIHEDADTMSRELEMWRAEAKAQSSAAKEAQRQTEESLHEIFAKLHAVEDNISDQLVKINITRATIINNDKTIETLLSMVVNPEKGGKKAAVLGKK